MYRIDIGVKITPKKAEELLNTMIGNRDLRNHKVAEYAELMRRGEWVYPNGETIKINRDGSLGDGQHRMWAVIESGVTITVDIAYDLKASAIRTVDLAIKRTGGDTLAMETKEKFGKDFHLKNKSQISSALVILAAYKWLDASPEVGSVPRDIYRKIRLSNQQIHTLYEAFPNITKSAEKVCKRDLLASASICTALHYIFSTDSVYKDRADEFFEKFISGENLPQYHPILTLRNKFMQIRGEARASLSREFTISSLLKAWEAFVNDRTMKTIYYSPQFLPQPYLGKKRKKVA